MLQMVFRAKLMRKLESLDITGFIGQNRCNIKAPAISNRSHICTFGLHSALISLRSSIAGIPSENATCGAKAPGGMFWWR